MGHTVAITDTIPIKMNKQPNLILMFHADTFISGTSRLALDDNTGFRYLQIKNLKSMYTLPQAVQYYKNLS